MYTTFYGLREKPFSLSPDPRFLYLAESHREALAHVLYGIEQGEGFIAVTGEVGTGKTTLCRTLLKRLGPDTEVAFVFNPSLSAQELLTTIASELGLPSEGSRAQLVDRLNLYLLEMKRAARRVLLIIDEAQNLPAETLEEIRLLSNLETSTSKLIQILLFGQPELDAVLDSKELRQLRQRIGVRWSLGPLSARETRDYVRHRLRIAARGPCELFTDAALRSVRRRTNGVPRLVNLLCDRALLAGYGAGARVIDAKLVDTAAREIRQPTRSAAWGVAPRRLLAAAAGIAAAGLATAAWLQLGPGSERTAAAEAGIRGAPEALLAAEAEPASGPPARPIQAGGGPS